MKPYIVLAICMVMFAVFFLPVSAYGQTSGKTVRVGWFDSAFNTIDKSGRRSGYAYEYQLKLSAYTGWNYQYVSGSWPELLQMLEEGKIDLLSDVSYTEARKEKMLFSSLPMGTEVYYLFVAPDDHNITPDDYSSLNGKKIGINKGSVQLDFYADWAEHNDVDAEVIELTCTEEESLRMLEKGEVDGLVSIDPFSTPDKVVPLCKIGTSDFFFAVRKDRQDLLRELNNAINRTQDEDRYYNQRLFEKYFKRTGANAFLSGDEVDWLADHGSIRVGYQDDYMAFCAADEKTGELTGGLKDYLSYASDCMANAHIDFEPVAYPTVNEAIDAMQRGQLDCVFPANLSIFDSETMKMVMTPAMMSSDIYAVVRRADQKVFTKKEHVIVAVNEGDPNYESFLSDRYPEWQKVYYPTIEDCLNAVSKGVADCILVSNYRYNSIEGICGKYHLSAFSTGQGMEFSFAVNSGDTTLYSILSKVIGLVPDSTVNAALSYYAAEDTGFTFAGFVAENLAVLIAVIVLLLLVIIVMLIRSIRAGRKARQMISATEIDELTGLYNRDYFFLYADRMFRDRPSIRMDAIVIDIDRFHSLNLLNGKEFGDKMLRTMGNEILEIANERGGIGGRSEADRFAVFCHHTDEYQEILDRLQSKLNGLSQNRNIRLRMGVMPWQADVSPARLFEMACAACSRAGRDRREHLIIFDERTREREELERSLQADLHRAVDEYEFEVYYQPEFNIQKDPPELVSVEALVRWRHPDLGTILPEEFIPPLERSGQIGRVDKFVWSEAARQIQRWQEHYGVDLPVSVNLSHVDVFDPSLEETLDNILEYNGLGPEMFRLEVTETAYAENPDQMIRIIRNLRKKGYKVEMDDFGAGNSSLNMLSSMPVDAIGMDRRFIFNIENNENDLQLVALILETARSLKIPAVAEGVETETQMSMLREMGCEIVQGYYFSRPLHATDFETKYLQDLPAAE